MSDIYFYSENNTKMRVFKFDAKEKETSLKNFVKEKVRVLFLEDIGDFVDITGDIVGARKGKEAEVSYKVAKILVDRGVAKLL